MDPSRCCQRKERKSRLFKFILYFLGSCACNPLWICLLYCWGACLLSYGPNSVRTSLNWSNQTWKVSVPWFCTLHCGLWLPQMMHCIVFFCHGDSSWDHGQIAAVWLLQQNGQELCPPCLHLPLFRPNPSSPHVFWSIRLFLGQFLLWLFSSV